MSLNVKVTNYIKKANKDQIILLEEIRQLIHQTQGEITEEIKWGFPVFAKGKDFAYLRFSKKHITLGFYNVQKIKDPDKLLEGEGNTLKHIKIKTKADIKEKIITRWLKEITG